MRIDDRVDFEPRLVAVMEDLRVQRLGVHAQVADDEGLEQKPKEVHVCDEALRVGSQSRDRE
jgi:hypothetical protein